MDVIRMLALWALVHEAADEEWKAAVARGAAEAPGGDDSPGRRQDVLAAMVDREKEVMKAELAAGGGQGETVRLLLEEVRFELASVRARMECLETSLEALRRRLDEA
jgi:hypothetical protein